MAQIWQSAVLPTYRRKSDVVIVVNGQDMTRELDPHLISVHCTLTRTGPDRAHIELDDSNAALPIPPNRAAVVIKFGWAGSGPTLPLSPPVERKYRTVMSSDVFSSAEQMPYRATGMYPVFQGEVVDVESGFSREGGGRRLWIDARSTNTSSAWKSPHLKTLGEGDKPDGETGEEYSLVDFLTKLGKDVGITVVGSPMVSNTAKRNFWISDGESFQSAGERLATSMGLGFKIIGNRAYVFSREFQYNGGPYPTVEATWGANLISWRIKPFSGRAEWKEAKQHFFDQFAGLFKTIGKSIGGSLPFGGSDAISKAAGYAPNAQTGSQTNDGQAMDSEWNRGEGWCTINGEPYAVPMGSIVISGARPGVDGRYSIDEAEHNYDRGTGYVTRCKLKRPSLYSEPYYGWAGGQAPTVDEGLQHFGYLTTPDVFNSDLPKTSAPTPTPTTPSPPISY